MKKIAKNLALMLFMVTTLASCTVTTNTNSTDKLIVGKWKCVSYYSNYPEHIDLAEVGDVWSFSDDGTLNFDFHGCWYDDNNNCVTYTEHVSSHYILSEKWLTFFSSQLGSYYEATTFSFEIIEISKDKLSLDSQALQNMEIGYDLHIEFEKVK